MKKWIAKAVVQKVISYLPFSNRVNFFFQKYITKGVFLSDEYFFDRLSHAENHLAGFSKLAGGTPRRTLELGTGWYPVAPLTMFLVGVEDVRTIDISPLLNKERLLTTLKKFVEAHENGRLQSISGIQESRLQSLKSTIGEADSLSFEEMLRRLHISYMVGDARKMPSIADGAIDLVHSNNTFEHVYPEVLSEILLEFKRVAGAAGVQSHFIDMSDHFAHFDRSITIYNFLRFSDWQWALIDNSIQPQNRYRMHDYQSLYADLGIPIQIIEKRPGNVEELATVRLNEKFAQRSSAELAISHCHFYSCLNPN